MLDAQPAATTPTLPNDVEIVFAAKLLLEFSENLKKHFRDSRSKEAAPAPSAGKGKRSRKRAAAGGRASKKRKVVKPDDEILAVNVDTSANAGPSSASSAPAPRQVPRRRSPANSTSAEQSSIVARVKSRERARRSQE